MSELDQTAATIRDTVPCRCCGLHTLNAYAMPALGKQPPRIYVECHNRACALHMKTREFENWLVMDLAQWNCAEQPGWQTTMLEIARQDNLTRLVETHILEHEAPLCDVVLRDFRESLHAALPHARRGVAEAWLHMYTWRYA